MIFRRLKSAGADWVYHFPELFVLDLASWRTDHERTEKYSPSEALAAERKREEHHIGVERTRAKIADINARVRDEAMDRPPPAIIRAYRQVYGRDPRGWPPA